MIKYDFHTHLGLTSSGETNSAAQLVFELSQLGISKAGVMNTNNQPTRERNDYIYQAMQEFPDFLEGYAFINPKEKDVFNEIDRCLGDYKMTGCKFQPYRHGYYSDNCPQLDDVITAIENYGRHIQVHVGTSPLCTPYVWTELAKKHKNMRFVFTHMGEKEFGYTVIELIKNIPNISVETSAQMEREILLKAAKELGYRRILFGTDWPYKPSKAEMNKILLLGFTDSELEYVYHKNAEELWAR